MKLLGCFSYLVIISSSSNSFHFCMLASTFIIVLLLVTLLLFVCSSSLVCFPNSDLLYFSLCDISCSLSLIENFLSVSPVYIMLHCSQLSLYMPLRLFLSVVSILLFIWVGSGKLFLILMCMLYCLSIFMNLLVLVPTQCWHYTYHICREQLKMNSEHDKCEWVLTCVFHIQQFLANMFSCSRKNVIFCAWEKGDEKSVLTIFYILGRINHSHQLFLVNIPY